MNIDILAYELKYKNDDDVLVLIRAYKDLYASQSDYDETSSSLEDAEDRLAELESSVGGAVSDIESVVQDLEDSKFKEDIELQIEQLSRIARELS